MLFFLLLINYDYEQNVNKLFETLYVGFAETLIVFFFSIFRVRMWSNSLSNKLCSFSRSVTSFKAVSDVIYFYLYYFVLAKCRYNFNETRCLLRFVTKI